MQVTLQQYVIICVRHHPSGTEHVKPDCKLYLTQSLVQCNKESRSGEKVSRQSGQQDVKKRNQKNAGSLSSRRRQEKQQQQRSSFFSPEPTSVTDD